MNIDCTRGKFLNQSLLVCIQKRRDFFDKCSLELLGVIKSWFFTWEVIWGRIIVSDQLKRKRIDLSE